MGGERGARERVGARLQSRGCTHIKEVHLEGHNGGHLLAALAALEVARLLVQDEVIVIGELLLAVVAPGGDCLALLALPAHGAWVRAAGLEEGVLVATWGVAWSLVHPASRRQGQERGTN